MLISQEFLDSLVGSRLNGVSGLMRVSNEEKTVRQSIESVINVVDELVVVYHNCLDNTVKILTDLAFKYKKISLHEYTQYVIPANTSSYTEGFNPIHSLANYYNFGLSKCKFNWFLKIDADQIYFEEELSKLFKCKETTKYYCMVGYNVTVDSNDDISVSTFESIPLNGCHGDHFLTEIKIGSCFRMVKYDDGSYAQCEQYYEPNLEWYMFDFSIGGAFWYHLRYFKDRGMDFYLSQEEKDSVVNSVKFKYLRSKLCDKYSDTKIRRIIKSFSKNKAKLLRRNFVNISL
jgi:hypothetical protein